MRALADSRTARLLAASIAGVAMSAPLAAEAQAAPRSFASAAEAEAFLAEALPAATAANPKYHTPGVEMARRWLTKTITFRNGPSGVVVASDETFEDYRGDVRALQGTHQVEFAIDDLAITLETTADLTPTGERAQGVLFKCLGPPCIHAVWNGEASVRGSTDFYIHDPAQRDAILAAFKTLQTKPEHK